MLSRIFLVLIFSFISLNQAMALTISHGTLTAEIFTNRNSIQSLLLSENKKILWVGTNGGLEKRDAQSGELLRVLTNKDNLPSNNITTLQNDISGGIWIGTMNGEIIYYDTNEKLTTFNKKNSKLSGTPICSLLNDGKGGVWIGEGTGTKSDTMLEETGLVHIQHDGKSAVFNSFNSDLYGAISGLSKDSDGNIWVGTNGGLSHYNINNANWETITKENGKLPSGNIGDLVSDKNGGLWIASGGGTCGSSYTYGGETASGLIYKNPNNEFVIFNKENSNLPDNYIQKLFTSDQKLIKINDNIMGLPSNEVTSILNRNGEILVGTDNGLFYKKQNKVEKFDLTNSPLPSDIINCLSSDTSQDDVWIGTNNGLARYSISNGQWLIFNTINSPYLLNNNILSLFTNKDGVWIGTENGLVFRSHTGEWTTLLSNEYIKTIYIDNKNSIWVSTGSRLLYKTSENIWLKFSATNSSLPSNMVTSIAGDTKGGIFIGTYRGGLVYIDNNKWQIFNKDNSKLPDNDIRSLAADRQGGVWIGTDKSGLVCYNNGQWITFNKANSQLLGDHIWSLSSDEQGIAFSMSDGELQGNYLVNIVGLGAGRFLFSNKIISSKIAIIIAGGGNENSNTLWDTTYSISNSIYSTLSKAKFNSDEIYYLSPVEWADFNGDGLNDRIVDAPKADRGLEAGDIQKALDWALERGKLDQPLYIFFVDHGGTDKLQLSKDNTLPVEQFKQMLDDYQTTTGNEIVLVIDACFSGVLGEKLKADKRSIITSTSNSYAYFNRLDKQGFSTFLTKGLSKRMNFNEAFSYATTEQTKLLNKMDLRVVVTGSTSSNNGAIEQIPRKFNGNQTYSLDKLFLNGSFVTGDATLSVKNIITSTQIKANTPISLKAQASVAQGDVKEVWAVVRPPRMDLILDSYNTPILAFPRVILSPTNTNNEWEGTLSNTRYNGNYKITFYAKDKDGDVVSSDETITLTISDGIEPPPQATLQIQLNQSSYKAGDLFKATITEELQWGYDLYVAVILPSGDFITLKEQNGFSNLNEIKTWYGKRQQGITNPFLELTLPALPTGQYCLFGALSPEGEPPLNAQKYWKTTQQCFAMN